jgi:hypothetical protein
MIPPSLLTRGLPSVYLVSKVFSVLYISNLYLKKLSLLECAKNRQTAKSNRSKPHLFRFLGLVSEATTVCGFLGSNRYGS